MQGDLRVLRARAAKLEKIGEDSQERAKIAEARFRRAQAAARAASAGRKKVEKERVELEEALGAANARIKMVEAEGAREKEKNELAEQQRDEMWAQLSFETTKAVREGEEEVAVLQKLLDESEERGAVLTSELASVGHALEDARAEIQELTSSGGDGRAWSDERTALRELLQSNNERLAAAEAHAEAMVKLVAEEQAKGEERSKAAIEAASSARWETSPFGEDEVRESLESDVKELGRQLQVAGEKSRAKDEQVAQLRETIQLLRTSIGRLGGEAKQLRTELFETRRKLDRSESDTHALRLQLSEAMEEVRLRRQAVRNSRALKNNE